MTPAGASLTKQDAPAVCLADLAGSSVGWEGIDSGIAIRNVGAGADSGGEEVAWAGSYQ